MEETDGDLRRPLLEGESTGYHNNSSNNNDDDDDVYTDVNNIDEEQAAAILGEWNASVSAFVADDGGDDNLGCFCSPIIDDHNGGSSENENNTIHSNYSGADAEANDANRQHENNAAVVATSRLPTMTVAAAKLATFCTATLLPDAEPKLGICDYDSIETSDDNTSDGGDVSDDNNEDASADRFRRRRRRNQPLRVVENVGVIKFLKFVGLTLGSIALVRKVVVGIGIDDRDTSLTLQQIWRYEGGSILKDLAFFFVVGRMHHRTGVDTLEWVGFGLLANLYFESQTFFRWMQHSATPYEMHCLWPWQLWAFASVIVVGAVGLGIAHAVVAHRKRRLWIAIGELLFCAGAFVGPVVGSQYAHFHHWFAGWLLGMHANLHDNWWSRATMAYCWGVYVNGIAVYGKDPLLTCDYAQFLARDQNCPIQIEQPEGALATATPPPYLFAFIGELLFSDPPNWRNCSSSGYHP